MQSNLLMTTLFSIFAPIFLTLKLKWSVAALVLTTLVLWNTVMLNMLSLKKGGLMEQISIGLFSYSVNSVVLFPLFISLASLNLVSFMIYSYPVTTTLSFNLGAALSCWLGGSFIQLVKHKPISSLLPLNTPWYLVPFLSVVELISILVRPITLCFRLLANMVAGHVLLALISKIPLFWSVGSLFGVLEILVAVVQAFVFSMLVSVYLEEAFTH